MLQCDKSKRQMMKFTTSKDLFREFNIEADSRPASADA